MAKDPSEVKDRTRAGGEVTLRDESDEIVDNLKARLTSLQSQLDAYKNADSRPQAAGGGGNEDLVSAWNAAVTPHLASRLQLPAEELTHRLDRLIEQRLIENIVRRAQLSATDAEVTQAISAIAAENGLTLRQMQQTIASHGLTIEEYRGKIKGEIERNKVLGSMVRSRVHVDEAEVRALYFQRYGSQRDSGSELHLRHLMIAVAAEKMRDQDTACRMASEIRAQIVAGELPFEQAARRFSDTNAERGGDLGWVHADELAAWMAPAVGDLQIGEVSKVLPMYFGCNLLMMIEQRDFQPVTFEQAQPALEQKLLERKMEEEYVRWIAKLREQVFVERKGIYAEASRLGGFTTR